VTTFDNTLNKNLKLGVGGLVFTGAYLQWCQHICVGWVHFRNKGLGFLPNKNLKLGVGGLVFTGAYLQWCQHICVGWVHFRNKGLGFLPKPLYF